MIIPYELWTKRKPNLNYLRVWGCRAVVRLPDPKLKILGERGIKCIFFGYAEHSKVFRLYVIKPNESVSINSIIESRDVIFDENRFSSVPRPNLRISNGTKDIGGSVVPEAVTKEVVVQQPEPKTRKIKRNRTLKNFRLEFQLYLIEGTRDEVSDQHSYCFNVKDDPKTFDEAMKSQDVAFWKEAINDEMDSIMGNNTWVLANLPQRCKSIFKRKLKVDESIEKLKARLVIQGFRQKSGTNYFDTYALVARISTIRLLIAIASIHNLIIHQMDVKTAFLNGELEEEVYINQPQGFIISDNENKVCKLIKSLYGLKQAPKQWHQKFDKAVLSNGYLLNQANKCVYTKFDKTGKGVIICLYVDNMLIFGIDQVRVDLTKEFLSSRFFMKDIREADVILVGKLSKYTSNPGTQHWKAIQQVLKYLNKTMDYSLIYTGYPSVLEGYTDASWISNTEDNSSTSGWPSSMWKAERSVDSSTCFTIIPRMCLEPVEKEDEAILYGTTLIIEKIGKFKNLFTSGHAILVDKGGNPLKKVEFSGEDDSEDEVASVDNDMARSMAYERVFWHSKFAGTMEGFVHSVVDESMRRLLTQTNLLIKLIYKTVLGSKEIVEDLDDEIVEELNEEVEDEIEEEEEEVEELGVECFDKFLIIDEMAYHKDVFFNRMIDEKIKNTRGVRLRVVMKSKLLGSHENDSRGSRKEAKGDRLRAMI
ncbi:zinc finger, CCHC-type containing protein [Tanacetum coccineum]